MLARASQLLLPRQAGREVTLACLSSPRRHLLAARALDASTSHLEAPGHAIPPCLSPFAIPHHGQRPCCRTVVVAAPSVVLAPRHRVHELRRRRLHRVGRAPSARSPRRRCTELALNSGHRRSLSPPPPHQLIPDLSDCLDETPVSSATSPPSPFPLSSPVATARSSPARTTTELVADEAPATQWPRHPAH